MATMLLLPISPHPKTDAQNKWPIGSPVQQQREHHQVAKSHHLKGQKNGDPRGPRAPITLEKCHATQDSTQVMIMFIYLYIYILIQYSTYVSNSGLLECVLDDKMIGHTKIWMVQVIFFGSNQLGMGPQLSHQTLYNTRTIQFVAPLVSVF